MRLLFLLVFLVGISGAIGFELGRKKGWEQGRAEMQAAQSQEQQDRPAQQYIPGPTPTALSTGPTPTRTSGNWMDQRVQEASRNNQKMGPQKSNN